MPIWPSSDRISPIILPNLLTVDYAGGWGVLVRAVVRAVVMVKVMARARVKGRGWVGWVSVVGRL